MIFSIKLLAASSPLALIRRIHNSVRKKFFELVNMPTSIIVLMSFNVVSGEVGWENVVAESTSPFVIIGFFVVFCVACFPVVVQVFVDFCYELVIFHLVNVEGCVIFESRRIFA